MSVWRVVATILPRSAVLKLLARHEAGIISTFSYLDRLSCEYGVWRTGNLGALFNKLGLKFKVDFNARHVAQSLAVPLEKFSEELFHIRIEAAQLAKSGQFDDTVMAGFPSFQLEFV